MNSHMENIIRVAITGAGGRIGEWVAHDMARRAPELFEKDTHVILSLLDIDRARERLMVVKMELEDSTYPALKEVIITSDPNVAFKQVDYAILIASVPTIVTPGWDRSVLMKGNGTIYVAHAQALDKHAHPNVKIFVVANPVSVLAQIIIRTAKSIEANQIFGLVTNDECRLKRGIADFLNVPSTQVHNVTIWGQHSTKMAVGISCSGYLESPDGKKTPLRDLISATDILKIRDDVRARGFKIVELNNGRPAAASVSRGLLLQMKRLIHGTEEGQIVSFPIVSDGSYGVKEGLIFAFPTTITNGKVTIVQGLDIADRLRDDIRRCQAELEADLEMWDQVNSQEHYY